MKWFFFCNEVVPSLEKWNYLKAGSGFIKVQGGWCSRAWESQLCSYPCDLGPHYLTSGNLVSVKCWEQKQE